MCGSVLTLAVRGVIHRRDRRYAFSPQISASGVGLRVAGRF
jgi:hypothetical protein